jgi:hypothetical protein
MNDPVDGNENPRRPDGRGRIIRKLAESSAAGNAIAAGRPASGPS